MGRIRTDSTAVPTKPASGAVFISAEIAEMLHLHNKVTILEVYDDGSSSEIAEDHYEFTAGYRYAVEGDIHYILTKEK